jgi:hypothetical protein
LAKPSEALRKPVPGRLFEVVKYASWFESVLFAALLFFWLAPGFDSQTSLFGLLHGLGFCALALLIWIAILRHEAPYTLLAATLTPFGPFGSVLGIWLIEHKGWGVAAPAAPRATNEGIDTNAP